MKPSFLSRNREVGPAAQTGDDAINVAPPTQVSPDSKEAGAEVEDQKPPNKLPSEDDQGGVQGVEAITLTWSKSHLVAAYTCMWLLYFIRAFQSSITANLGAYVVSGFDSHSLIPVIGIVSSVMSAATYFPMAKVLNIWGRPLGFVVMAAIGTLGILLSAVCNNIETYCAAQVFYSVGFTGMIFSVDVITADTSSMRDRALAFALTSSPYIITAFGGPKASERFYETNWRWAYGAFSIVLPVVAAPMFLNLYMNERRAKANGLLIKVPSGRTFTQSCWHYAVEFDLVAVFLLAAGLVLFLLPFSLAESAADKWKSAHIIVMLVIGFACLVAFGAWERFVAPKPFIPYNLLLSKNIIGACLLDATYQIAYYCWASYFTSLLQVVFDVTIAEAGYINSIFDVVNGVWLLAVGYLIRRTGTYKWLLLISVPLYMLFTGLLIKFRTPDSKVGYVVMCEIFIALAGGTMILGQQIAVMAVATHDEIAAVLAILGLFGNVGGAIGGSISGAIWTNSVPGALQRLLPDEVKPDWETIYNDLSVQVSYPMGDPVRDAIIEAYGIGQRRMLIAGTVIMSSALVWVLLLKNVNVTKIEQVKGLLF